MKGYFLVIGEVLRRSRQSADPNAADTMGEVRKIVHWRDQKLGDPILLVNSCPRYPSQWVEQNAR
eukprot:4862092-Prymnesium_polylepis.2